MDVQMANPRQATARRSGVAHSDSPTIRIAKQLELDRRAATQKFGIIARSEAGKTYLAGKLVEGLHGIGCQVIVFDPVGNWWGLTLAANGKDPGLPFVVFGGRRGHLPLTPDNGRRIARLVIERNLSVVLDLTGLRKRRQPGRGGDGESEFQRFVADFEEEALEASQSDPKPRMAVYDEAHKMLPQVMKSGGNRMLDAGEDLIRTGRNYGWGCVQMSQRPQSIHKEVLSQVECFFVGQLTEPHARERLKEWIVEKNADVKRELDDLATLERGEFYCWSPQWLRTFKKIRVLPKWTFDASRTPELGELLVPSGQAGGSISGAELQALRRALEAGAAAPPASPSANGAAGVERERDLRKAAEARAVAAEDDLARLQKQVDGQRQTLAELHERLGGLLGTPEAAPRPPPTAQRDGAQRRASVRVDGQASASASSPPPSGAAEGAADGSPPIDKCQRAILTVLVQQNKALPKARLALMAGYSPNSGGFNNALSKLRTAGRIEGRGETAATALGKKAVGRVAPLPQGDELFDYWVRHPRLDKCSRAIVSALRGKGGAVGKEELARLTGYSANSGGFNNALSKLRTLGLIQGRGAVEIMADLAGGQ